MLKKLLCLLLVIAALCALGACGAAGKKGPKYIAITFDDGPHPTWTPVMLDGLAERDVHATFFLWCEWISGNEELIARMRAEGHQICSHTFSHEALTDKTDEAIVQELSACADALRPITGQSEFWLRPPYGFCDERVAALCDVPVILWSIDPAAGKTVPADKMEKTIVRKAKDGAIILMHDTTEANIIASLNAIDKLKEKGYEFVTVEELFKLKGVTPLPGVTYRKIKG